MRDRPRLNPPQLRASREAVGTYPPLTRSIASRIKLFPYLGSPVLAQLTMSARVYAYLRKSCVVASGLRCTDMRGR